ncbi:hypothetical protein [Paenibacillus wynnii]|uniref:Uncharacterized protein n=1 Tax=Paenibacillus wynnii TaxID=268407 RepID=A0A098M496_9BACL|nr:hypothetical protein [Paenibacillus wynnii]KGE17374.1 hypothetical protein PWYN_22450 [Paenibacillus wynnii]
MIALIAYLMRSYTRSQRYFASLSGIVIAVLVLYSYKPNPIMNSYAATAVILFIGCAAMGLSFLNHEQAVQRQVVIVHLRSARIYNIGGILSLTLLALLLDVMIVVYPMITGRFPEPVGIYRFLLALIGHGLLGLLGISISLFLQSSWVAKRSHAVGLMLASIILSIGGTQISSLLEGPLIPLRFLLPPVAPVMNALMNGDTLSTSGVLTSFAHVSLYIVLLIGIYVFKSGTKDYSRI